VIVDPTRRPKSTLAAAGKGGEHEAARGATRREKERERERGQEKWLIPDIYVGGKVGVVTGLEIAAITLESQKRPTDQKINPPVDLMELDHREPAEYLVTPRVKYF